MVELVDVKPVTGGRRWWSWSRYSLLLGAGGGAVGRGTACYWGQAVVQLVEVQSVTGGRRWRSWSRYSLLLGAGVGAVGRGTVCYWGQAVVQLVEALRYKPEGHGFDSQ